MFINSRVVNLRNQGLKLESAAAIDDLFKGIDLADVEEVILTGNTLGVDAAEGLGNVLRKMTKLKVAQLSSIFISRSIDEIPPALTFICNALLECKQLTEVDLSHNAFGQRSVDPVVPLLSDCLSLQVVKLANVGLNWQGGQILAQALLTSAKKSKELDQPSKLKCLVISRNLLKDGSASTWGEVIAAHPNLQRLDMLRTDLREDGIIAIASALAKCRSLRHLNLCDNVIANYGAKEGVRGWKVVADAIRAAEDLRYLDLSSCVLEKDGCDEIIAALGEQSYPRLRKVNLNGNDFSEANYATLKDVITDKLPALTILNIADNDGLEDNDVVAEIGTLLEGRGGRLILEEEDEDEDLYEDTSDLDGEGAVEPRIIKSEDLGVDQLADMISTNLTLQV
ncbi:Ran GAP Rna1 [Paramarasmius palmivorus]|uniref:Ran GAP Rna1 n=1 Tax=Paramarasmius palmivorus TaxID=297713 RepID=A0AAW0ASS8_9AGAR